MTDVLTIPLTYTILHLGAIRGERTVFAQEVLSRNKPTLSKIVKAKVIFLLENNVYCFIGMTDFRCCQAPLLLLMVGPATMVFLKISHIFPSIIESSLLGKI